MRSDAIWVVLKYGDAGMLEQGSLEERIRRAEHDVGLLPINARGRQSHCWLCRQAWENQQDAERGRL